MENIDMKRTKNALILKNSDTTTQNGETNNCDLHESFISLSPVELTLSHLGKTNNVFNIFR